MEKSGKFCDITKPVKVPGKSSKDNFIIVGLV